MEAESGINQVQGQYQLALNGRLFYSCGDAQAFGLGVIKTKFEKLRITIAHRLIQHITVTQLGIEETQFRTTHFVDGEAPTIFVAADLEQSVSTSFISQHLAEYFGCPSLKGDVALILGTPERYLGELLTITLKIPELPNVWIQSFKADQLPIHLQHHIEIDDVLTESPMTDMSQKEAANIMGIINATLGKTDDRTHGTVNDWNRLS